MEIIPIPLLLVFVNFLITLPKSTISETDSNILTIYNFSEEEKIQKEIRAIITSEVTNASANLSQLNRKSIFSKTSPITKECHRILSFHHPNTFNHLILNFCNQLVFEI